MQKYFYKHLSAALLIVITFVASEKSFGQGFLATASNWDIPFLDDAADRSYGYHSEHLIIDINGDNKPDLIDLEDDNNVNSTWMNGAQQYWKVFLNNGNGFSSAAANWNIPYLDGAACRSNGYVGEHLIQDMNGDGKPDLVDLEDDVALNATWLNGTQKYWKVYVNSGNGFSTTAENWNIPFLDDAAYRSYGYVGEHALIDMNGDDKPDLIDFEDDPVMNATWMNGTQKYWKVFINTGNGFSSTAQDWNIPYLDMAAYRSYGYVGEHLIMDMNGDHKADLVDLEEDVAMNVTWMNGSQKFWKVYTNTGSGFSSASDWNIPFLDIGAYRSSGFVGTHLVMDMNGDDKPDLVDLEDDINTSYPWLNGAQQYWKVFIGSGNGFASAATNYNIPFLDIGAYRSFGYSGEHLIMDMNGDNKADLVDLEDDVNTTITWLNGSQKYWKVYTDNSVTIETVSKSFAISVFPNPISNTLVVNGTALNGEVILNDFMGREILRQKTSIESTSIDSRGLRPGFYFVTYIEENKSQNIPVVKF